MLIATVVGHVWATIKDPTLEGVRFLVVQPWTLAEKDSAETIVAVDRLGAGIGERVLVVFGRAARHVIGKGHDIGFQTAVAAIVDRMELADGRSVGPTRNADRAGPGASPREPAGEAATKTKSLSRPAGPARHNTPS